MTDAYTTTLERYRQNRETQMSDALDRRAHAQQNDAAARGTFPAGTRVLDLVTGLEGVTVAALPALALTSNLVGVKLDRGDLLTRNVSQLLKRPTPPSA